MKRKTVFAISAIVLLTAGANGASPFENPWKRPVQAWQPTQDVRRDAELPWTVADYERLFGRRPEGRGLKFISETYDRLVKRVGCKRARNWYGCVLEGLTDFTLTGGELERAWNDYGRRAFFGLEPARTAQALEGLARCGGTPSGHLASHGVQALAMYEDVQSFPLDTEQMKFPKENIWVSGKRTVRAKTFGWDPEDATDCIRRALEADADIVVLDRMKTPWRVGDTIRVPANRTIVFENGVRVVGTEMAQSFNTCDAMFVIRNVENVALIGKGDVQIGWYPDGATRDRFLKGEGGCGIVIGDSRNVLVRGIRVCECGCDGLMVGGGGVACSNIYVEDVVLDHNARQALTLSGCRDVFFRNVQFLNTCGAQPMCGVDFEPNYPAEAIYNIYFMGCRFNNNIGGNVMFSAYSFYPITVMFKDCEMGPDRTAIYLGARVGIYTGNRTDAPSDIIFDGCTIRGRGAYLPILIAWANLFHVTFRGCSIVQSDGDRGTMSPVRYDLNYEFYNPRTGDRSWYQKEGSLVFDGTRVKGWKDAPVITYNDMFGHYSVSNVFGSVKMNGRSVSMDKFRHRATDFAFQEVSPEIRPEDLRAPKRTLKSRNGEVRFVERPPWWLDVYSYELYVSREDGSYACRKIEKDTAGMIQVNKRGYAFRSTSTGGFFWLAAPSTVYFEVPAGRGEAVLKLVGAQDVELLKGRKHVVRRYVREDNREGHVFVRIRRERKPQVYGLRANSGNLVFKLFDPFSGVVATDPASLPVYVPPVKVAMDGEKERGDET